MYIHFIAFILNQLSFYDQDTDFETKCVCSLQCRQNDEHAYELFTSFCNIAKEKTKDSYQRQSELVGKGLKGTLLAQQENGAHIRQFECHLIAYPNFPNPVNVCTEYYMSLFGYSMKTSQNDQTFRRYFVGPGRLQNIGNGKNSWMKNAEPTRNKPRKAETKIEEFLSMSYLNFKPLKRHGQLPMSILCNSLYVSFHQPKDTTSVVVILILKSTRI